MVGGCWGQTVHLPAKHIHKTAKGNKVHEGKLSQATKTMRTVVQRVSRAKVTVSGTITGEVGLGLLVLLGVGHEDTESDVNYLAEKIAGLRVFEDADGKMNRSVRDAGGSVLAVSQFTCGETCAAGSAHPLMTPLPRNTLAACTNCLSIAFVLSACAARLAGFGRQCRWNW